MLAFMERAVELELTKAVYYTVSYVYKLYRDAQFFELLAKMSIWEIDLDEIDTYDKKELNEEKKWDISFEDRLFGLGRADNFKPRYFDID